MMQREELAAIYDEHAGAVFGFLTSMSGCEAGAADLTQEVFVRIGRRFEAIHDVENWRSYLLRVAYRAAVDAGRRREVRTRKEGEAERERAFCTYPEADPDRELFRKALEEALGELPDEQRAVVWMKLWGGLTFSEIAEAVGISENTAASRYRYAIDKLRGPLRPLYEEIR